MQSDRTVETHVDPPGSRPVAGGYPAQPVSEVEEDHEVDLEHVHLPPVSIWPITLAGGITLAGMGLVTNSLVSVVGGVLSFIAIVSWVQELRHELH
jgi:hypothetical protein